MNTSQTSGIFKPASSKSIELLKELNESKKNTFFIPTGLMSAEAGQVGFLFNECFKNGRDVHSRAEFRTFFVNSRFEAIQGAVKIARANLSQNRKNTKTIVIYDSQNEIEAIFDPLKRGEEKALVPEILFFSGLDDLSKYMNDLAFPPIALILRVDSTLTAATADEFFQQCKDNDIITTLDCCNIDFNDQLAIIQQLTLLPDVIISGESLTNNEIPFAAFSMKSNIHRPWSRPLTCMSHVSTCGGNRLALRSVRDYMLKNVPYLKDNRYIELHMNRIQQSDIERYKAFSRFINPGLAEIYMTAGLDIDPVHAHRITLTLEKNGSKEKINDFTGGGGLLARGHNSDDIIPEVLNQHDPNENYWQKISEKLSEYTGLSQAFPAVSGSTCVEIGIILAMLAKKEKSRIIVFKGNYAGTTLISLIGTENEGMRRPFFPLYYDVLYIDPFNAKAKDILLKELKSGKVALVWLEIFQGQMARRLPSELLELVKTHKTEGDYLIGIDEVLTGIYRTGPFLAYQEFFESPDVITIFKGLTDAAFPFGMTMVSDQVYRQASANRAEVVQFLQNLYLNQLGAHIGYHLLEKIDSIPDLGNHVKQITAMIKRGFDDLSRNSPYISAVNGDGLYYRFQYNPVNSLPLKLFGKRSATMSRTLFPLYMSRLYRSKAKALFYFDACLPALITTEDEIRSLINKLNAISCNLIGRLGIYIGFPRFMKRIARRKSRPKMSRIKKISIMFQKFFGGIQYIAKSLRNKDVSTHYTLLGDDLMESLNRNFVEPKKSLWHNNGYWKTARTYPEACKALAKLLADAAKLNANDHILDVAFGFAEQDIFWAQDYQVAHIDGINITPIQNKFAELKVQEHGLDSKIKLYLGSATELPFENNQYDKVLCLESAFHFDTREKFLEEAYRVLRPGGTLALTDMLPSPGSKTDGLFRHLGRRQMHFPKANMFDREVYAKKLEEAGYTNISIESIRNYVYPGSAKYLMLRMQDKLDLETAVVDLSEFEINTCSGVQLWDTRLGISDYVLVTANKPE